MRPANFLISFSVHVGSSSRVANSWGYLETSSNPVGVLENDTDADTVPLIGLVFYFAHSENKRRIGIYSNGSHEWQQFHNLRGCLHGSSCISRIVANPFIDVAVNASSNPASIMMILWMRNATADTQKIITNLSRRSQLLSQRDRSPPPFECDWCVLKQHRHLIKSIVLTTRVLWQKNAWTTKINSLYIRKWETTGVNNNRIIITIIELQFEKAVSRQQNGLKRFLCGKDYFPNAKYQFSPKLIFIKLCLWKFNERQLSTQRWEFI